MEGSESMAELQRELFGNEGRSMLRKQVKELLAVANRKTTRLEQKLLHDEVEKDYAATREELPRDEDERMRLFVAWYKFSIKRYPTTVCLQAWWRMTFKRRRFLSWRQRRVTRKTWVLDNWKLVHRFHRMRRTALIRRIFFKWKTDLMDIHESRLIAEKMLKTKTLGADKPSAALLSMFKHANVTGMARLQAEPQAKSSDGGSQRLTYTQLTRSFRRRRNRNSSALRGFTKGIDKVNLGSNLVNANCSPAQSASEVSKNNADVLSKKLEYGYMLHLYRVYFSQWRKYSKELKKRRQLASWHLARMAKMHHDPHSRILWKGEQVKLMFTMWYRVAMFRKVEFPSGVMCKGDPSNIPNDVVLPQFDELVPEWEDWVDARMRLYRGQREVLQMQPIFCKRRYFVNWLRSTKNSKHLKKLTVMASEWYDGNLKYKVLQAWFYHARNRGRSLREALRIIHAWHAYAKKKILLRPIRAQVVKDRVNTNRRSVFATWRSEMKKVKLRDAVSGNLLTENQALYNKGLTAMLKWKGSMTHYTLLKCWESLKMSRGLGKHWKRYNFVSKRDYAMKLLNICFRKWAKKKGIPKSQALKVIDRENQLNRMRIKPRGEFEVQDLEYMKKILLARCNLDVCTRRDKAQEIKLGLRTSTQSRLHAAVIEGNIIKVHRLLEEGADPNLVDKQGNTPLHLVAKRIPLVFTGMAAVLLRHGAVNMVNDVGKSVMDSAINPTMRALLDHHFRRIETKNYTDTELERFRNYQLSRWQQLNSRHQWREIVLLRRKLSVESSSADEISQEGSPRNYNEDDETQEHAAFAKQATWIEACSKREVYIDSDEEEECNKQDILSELRSNSSLERLSKFLKYSKMFDEIVRDTLRTLKVSPDEYLKQFQENVNRTRRVLEGHQYRDKLLLFHHSLNQTRRKCSMGGKPNDETSLDDVAQLVAKSNTNNIEIEMDENSTSMPNGANEVLPEVFQSNEQIELVFKNHTLKPCMPKAVRSVFEGTVRNIFKLKKTKPKVVENTFETETVQQASSLEMNVPKVNDIVVVLDNDNEQSTHIPNSQVSNTTKESSSPSKKSTTKKLSVVPAIPADVETIAKQKPRTGSTTSTPKHKNKRNKARVNSNAGGTTTNDSNKSQEKSPESNEMNSETMRNEEGSAQDAPNEEELGEDDGDLDVSDTEEELGTGYTPIPLDVVSVYIGKRKRHEFSLHVTPRSSTIERDTDSESSTIDLLQNSETHVPMSVIQSFMGWKVQQIHSSLYRQLDSTMKLQKQMKQLLLDNPSIAKLKLSKSGAAARSLSDAGKLQIKIVKHWKQIIVECTSAIADSEHEQERVKSELEKAHHRKQEIQDVSTSLKHSIQEAVKQSGTTVRQIENLRKEIANKGKQLSNQIKQLAAECESTKRNIASIAVTLETKTSLLEVEKRVKAKPAHVRKQVAIIETLEHKIRSLQTNQTVLQASLKSSQSKLEESRLKLQEFKNEQKMRMDQNYSMIQNGDESLKLKQLQLEATEAKVNMQQAVILKLTSELKCVSQYNEQISKLKKWSMTNFKWWKNPVFRQEQKPKPQVASEESLQPDSNKVSQEVEVKQVRNDETSEKKAKKLEEKGRRKSEKQRLKEERKLARKEEKKNAKKLNVPSVASQESTNDPKQHDAKEAGKDTFVKNSAENSVNENEKHTAKVHMVPTPALKQKTKALKKRGQDRRKKRSSMRAAFADSEQFVNRRSSLSSIEDDTIVPSSAVVDEPSVLDAEDTSQVQEGLEQQGVVQQVLEQQEQAQSMTNNGVAAEETETKISGYQRPRRRSTLEEQIQEVFKSIQESGGEESDSDSESGSDYSSSSSSMSSSTCSSSSSSNGSSSSSSGSASDSSGSRKSSSSTSSGSSLPECGNFATEASEEVVSQVKAAGQSIVKVVSSNSFRRRKNGVLGFCAASQALLQTKKLPGNIRKLSSLFNATLENITALQKKTPTGYGRSNSHRKSRNSINRTSLSGARRDSAALPRRSTLKLLHETQAANNENGADDEVDDEDSGELGFDPIYGNFVVHRAHHQSSIAAAQIAKQLYSLNEYNPVLSLIKPSDTAEDDVDESLTVAIESKNNDDCCWKAVDSPSRVKAARAQRHNVLQQRDERAVKKKEELHRKRSTYFAIPTPEELAASLEEDEAEEERLRVEKEKADQDSKMMQRGSVVNVMKRQQKPSFLIPGLAPEIIVQPDTKQVTNVNEDLDTKVIVTPSLKLESKSPVPTTVLLAEVKLSDALESSDHAAALSRDKNSSTSQQNVTCKNVTKCPEDTKSIGNIEHSNDSNSDSNVILQKMEQEITNPIENQSSQDEEVCGAQLAESIGPELCREEPCRGQSMVETHGIDGELKKRPFDLFLYVHAQQGRLEQEFGVQHSIAGLSSPLAKQFAFDDEVILSAFRVIEQSNQLRNEALSQIWDETGTGLGTVQFESTVNLQKDVSTSNECESKVSVYPQLVTQEATSVQLPPAMALVNNNRARTCPTASRVKHRFGIGSSKSAIVEAIMVGSRNQETSESCKVGERLPQLVVCGEKGTPGSTVIIGKLSRKKHNAEVLLEEVPETSMKKEHIKTKPAQPLPQHIKAGIETRNKQPKVSSIACHGTQQPKYSRKNHQYLIDHKLLPIDSSSNNSIDNQEVDQRGLKRSLSQGSKSSNPIQDHSKPSKRQTRHMKKLRVKHNLRILPPSQESCVNSFIETSNRLKSPPGELETWLPPTLAKLQQKRKPKQLPNQTIKGEKDISNFQLRGDQYVVQTDPELVREEHQTRLEIKKDVDMKQRVWKMFVSRPMSPLTKQVYEALYFSNKKLN